MFPLKSLPTAQIVNHKLTVKNRRKVTKPFLTLIFIYFLLIGNLEWEKNDTLQLKHILQRS